MPIALSDSGWNFQNPIHNPLVLLRASQTYDTKMKANLFFDMVTNFYRTRVRSLAMLVTTSLTDCRLGNLIDVVTVIDVDDEK